MLRSLFRAWRRHRFPYESLIEVRVSRTAIERNLELFAQAVPHWQFAPVLKANAYGHGLIDVAQIVENKSVPFIVIDSYHEALMVRNEGIRTPLLVIGHTPTPTIVSSRLKNVSFAVASVSQLRELASSEKVPTLHLKFDTGMHRQGIMLDECSEVMDIVSQHSQLHVDGMCSHLADADAPQSSHAQVQIRAWNKIVATWRERFPATRFYHVSATAGVAYANTIDANVGRLGIGLYGISNAVPGLTPALSLTTRISAIRTVETGESVGYNATWQAPQPTRVATIPAGYHEGVDRRLSNKGHMMVRGVSCPIVGRVSMNMTTIDVSRVPDVKEGDEVEIIGTDSSLPNSVETIARACGDIPWVILVHVNGGLKRVVK